MRHESPGEERRDRVGRCADQRGGGERHAAPFAWHQFGQVGIDGDELDADADAREKAPEHQADIAGLQRHDEGRDAVPDQRVGEDGAPAEIVGQRSQPLGADEHADEGRRDEARIAVDVKEPLGGRDHEPRLVEAGCDERDQTIVEDVEEGAERQQDDAATYIGRRRQPIHACSDGGRGRCRVRDLDRHRDVVGHGGSSCCSAMVCLAIAPLHQLSVVKSSPMLDCAEPRPRKAQLPRGPLDRRSGSISGLRPGGRVKFFVHPDGSVALLPKPGVAASRGIARSRQCPVTIEAMDAAIAAGTTASRDDPTFWSATSRKTIRGRHTRQPN